MNIDQRRAEANVDPDMPARGDVDIIAYRKLQSNFR